jgi:hypothetical protein
MKRSLAILAAGLCVCLVQAEQFWISYDAACGQYPEQVGWTRTTHAGGAVRSISDGILTLDSTADPMIEDCYRIDRPITPGPGEMFVAEWRVCVAQQSGYWEVLAGAQADDGGQVVLDYKEDYVRSFWDGWSLPIASGAFHTYRLESTTMHDFSLWIDGTYAHSGAFDRPGPPIPFVAFGDASYGASTSLTEWEYFRFGVVPEPGAIALAFAVCAYVARRRGRERILFKGELL